MWSTNAVLLVVHAHGVYIPCRTAKATIRLTRRRRCLSIARDPMSQPNSSVARVALWLRPNGPTCLGVTLSFDAYAPVPDFATMYRCHTASRAVPRCQQLAVSFDGGWTMPQFVPMRAGVSVIVRGGVGCSALGRNADPQRIISVVSRVGWSSSLSQRTATPRLRFEPDIWMHLVGDLNEPKTSSR